MPDAVGTKDTRHSELVRRAFHLEVLMVLKFAVKATPQCLCDWSHPERALNSVPLCFSQCLIKQLNYVTVRYDYVRENI